MTITDLWHYPRTELAQQVLGMFNTGLSSALVFFAPRRMGKTEFLRKDIQPLAEKLGWHVVYFSFLDVGCHTAAEFNRVLVRFAEEIGAFPKKSLPKKISKMSGAIMGIKAEIELQSLPEPLPLNIKELLMILAKKSKILLLMDEVQTLCQYKENEDFIASLRTALDMNKDTIKVIFTGSSQEGLRQMFSQAKAPFFHFGQNLPFPELDKKFTDHLASIFTKVSKRQLNHIELWKIFVEMEKVPQLLRSLVERLVLNPNLSIQEIKTQLLAQLHEDRAFAETWRICSALERLLLIEITLGTTAVFRTEIRNKLAEQLGIDKLSPTTVQSALKTLQKKNIIGHLESRGMYYIIDPTFKKWVGTYPIQGNPIYSQS